MKTEYNCARCGALRTISLYIRSRWDKPTPDRCEKCGAVHTILRGDVDVISPPMLPVTASNRLSPWQLWMTRPLQPGYYDCRFMDVADWLTLYWNGSYFQPSDSDARMVRMGTFMSWRGSWA